MELLDLSDLIGTPYSKMKCYDLAMEVYKRLGLFLPDYRNNEEVLYKGLDLIKIEKAEKYCIILFDNEGSSHIGVYLGYGRMIHATEMCGVVIEDLRRMENKIKGFYKANHKSI